MKITAKSPEKINPLLLIKTYPVNVIKIETHPQMIDAITNFVKTEGFDRTEKRMLKENFHPAFIKAILKRIMKRNAW